MSSTYWKLAWTTHGDYRVLGIFNDPDRAALRASEAVKRAVESGYEVREAKPGGRWLITGKTVPPQVLELYELGFDQ
jgi:hypothetical protein